jgi:hypothetical protein
VHDQVDEVVCWAGVPLEERVAAVEILLRRMYGGAMEFDPYFSEFFDRSRRPSAQRRLTRDRPELPVVRDASTSGGERRIALFVGEIIDEAELVAERVLHHGPVDDR